METKLVEKLKTYFEKHKIVRYRKGETILRPGEKPNFIGFIKSGYVRVYTLSENGQEVTMPFFKPVFYLTTIFVYTGTENRFYLEAMTPVEMYEATIEETRDFFKDNPETTAMVMNNIMSSFVDLMEQTGALLSGEAYNRVATIILLLDDRSEKNGNNYAKINFGVTHKLIAGLTGLTRETVTLQMLRLEREGLVVNKSKKVTITNRAGLIKAAKKGK
jgi:CRP-like cAMP-binding protein